MRWLLKLLNVVNAFSDVVVIVRMDNIENRFPDQLLSTCGAPKFYCCRIDINKLPFAMNDDRIGREFNQASITFFTLFQCFFGFFLIGYVSNNTANADRMATSIALNRDDSIQTSRHAARVV